MTTVALFDQAVKQVAQTLRATPKHARLAHWQIASRRLRDARMMKDRNFERATQLVSEAMFASQSIFY
ncbi:MAG TPA: hypothetical protein VF681_05805 [Abditibacteriaceae bacterium]|jgi:hypothetical protein